MLTGAEIRHYGQPVALVVAATFEQARAAAKLIDVEYAVEPGNYDFAANQERSYMPHLVNADLQCETAVGDFDTGFSSAAVKIDQTLHDAVSVLAADGTERLPGGAARR